MKPDLTTSTLRDPDEPSYAGPLTRLGAVVVDAFVLGLLALLITTLLGWVGVVVGADVGLSDGQLNALGLTVTATTLSALCLMRLGDGRGQTPGKWLMQIRVLRLDGHPLGPGLALSRELVLKGLVAFFLAVSGGAVHLSLGFGSVSIGAYGAALFLLASSGIFVGQHRAGWDFLSATIVVNDETAPAVTGRPVRGWPRILLALALAAIAGAAALGPLADQRQSARIDAAVHWLSGHPVSSVDGRTIQLDGDALGQGWTEQVLSASSPSGGTRFLDGPAATAWVVRLDSKSGRTLSLPNNLRYEVDVFLDGHNHVLAGVLFTGSDLERVITYLDDFKGERIDLSRPGWRVAGGTTITLVGPGQRRLVVSVNEADQALYLTQLRHLHRPAPGPSPAGVPNLFPSTPASVPGLGRGAATGPAVATPAPTVSSHRTTPRPRRVKRHRHRRRSRLRHRRRPCATCRITP